MTSGDYITRGKENSPVDSMGMIMMPGVVSCILQDTVATGTLGPFSELSILLDDRNTNRVWSCLGPFTERGSLSLNQRYGLSSW